MEYKERNFYYEHNLTVEQSPREVVLRPSLDVFKLQTDKALSILV